MTPQCDIYLEKHWLGNGLLPYGFKPLHEPKLTGHESSVATTWEQFHKFTNLIRNPCSDITRLKLLWYPPMRKSWIQSWIELCVTDLAMPIQNLWDCTCVCLCVWCPTRCDIYSTNSIAWFYWYFGMPLTVFDYCMPSPFSELADLCSVPSTQNRMLSKCIIYFDYHYYVSNNSIVSGAT